MAERRQHGDMSGSSFWDATCLLSSGGATCRVMRREPCLCKWEMRKICQPDKMAYEAQDGVTNLGSDSQLPQKA